MPTQSRRFRRRKRAAKGGEKEAKDVGDDRVYPCDGRRETMERDEDEESVL